MICPRGLVIVFSFELFNPLINEFGWVWVSMGFKIGTRWSAT